MLPARCSRCVCCPFILYPRYKLLGPHTCSWSCTWSGKYQLIYPAVVCCMLQSLHACTDAHALHAPARWQQGCSPNSTPVHTCASPQCFHVAISRQQSSSPGFVPHQREYSADSTEIKKQLVVRLAARQLMWCTQDGRRCARWYGSGLRRSKRAPGRALLPLQLWCGAGCLSLPSCGLKVWCLSCQVLRKSAHCTQGLASTTSTPNTGWTLAALTLALLDQL